MSVKSSFSWSVGILCSSPGFPEFGGGLQSCMKGLLHWWGFAGAVLTALGPGETQAFAGVTTSFCLMHQDAGPGGATRMSLDVLLCALGESEDYGWEAEPQPETCFFSSFSISTLWPRPIKQGHLPQGSAHPLQRHSSDEMFFLFPREVALTANRNFPLVSSHITSVPWGCIKVESKAVC